MCVVVAFQTVEFSDNVVLLCHSIYCLYFEVLIEDVSRKVEVCSNQCADSVEDVGSVMVDPDVKVPFWRGWVKGRGFAKSTWKSLDFTGILWSTHLSSAPYLSFRSSCH